MEEEGGPLAGLSAGAMKLLLALLLRGGEWASNADMQRLSGLPARTYYRAKAEVEAVPVMTLVAQLRATYGNATANSDTPPLARPATSSPAGRPLRSETEEYEDEEAAGNYGGRRPKTAEDEAAMRRMERLEKLIEAKRGGRITW